MHLELKAKIEEAWENRSLLKEVNYNQAIRETIELLDNGAIRVAEMNSGVWLVNEWIKKAVLLFFPISEMQTLEVGPFEFYDKIPLKKGFQEKNVRVVPHAIARYGSYLSPGVILMP